MCASVLIVMTILAILVVKARKKRKRPISNPNMAEAKEIAVLLDPNRITSPTSAMESMLNRPKSYSIVVIFGWSLMIASMIIPYFLAISGYGYLISDPVMRQYGYEHTHTRVTHGRHNYFYFTYSKQPVFQ
ncbi:MAG: hypothetical protein B7X02_01165 [Rhodospirillales bacterium 12-54-5]|nr:MAG: hypothetical protein B7X02_01165 [Rhodospirillales bacterium 12-54-5]